MCFIRIHTKHAEPQSFREFITSLIESKVIFEKELLTTKNDLVNTQNKITLLLSEKNKILTSLNNWGTKYKYEMSQMSSHIKMLESMLSQDVKKFQEGHVSKLCVDLGQKCLEFWKLHIDETRELLFQEKAEINLKLEKIVQQLNLETDVFNKKQKHWEFLNKNKMDHPFFDNITIIKQVATFVQNQIELNKTINK